MPVSFHATRYERELTREIALRAEALMAPDKELDLESTEMDLIATHANGNRLDFERLAAASDADLMHDIHGIAHNLDRTTGQLMNCFTPRFSLRQ